MADLKAGDRIELVAMADDPNPIEVGTIGTVVLVTKLHIDEPQLQVAVSWDNGRTLGLVVPPDKYRKL